MRRKRTQRKQLEIDERLFLFRPIVEWKGFCALQQHWIECEWEKESGSNRQEMCRVFVWFVIVLTMVLCCCWYCCCYWCCYSRLNRIHDGSSPCSRLVPSTVSQRLAKDINGWQTEAQMFIKRIHKFSPLRFVNALITTSTIATI